MTPPVSERESSSNTRRPVRRRFDRLNRSSVSDDDENNQEVLITQEQQQQPKETDQIIVTILDSAQNKFFINVLTDSTVLELKQRGHEVHSIPPEQQRLISMGQLLQDDKLIADHNIINGSIVHLFPKPNVVITEANANGNSNRSSGSQGNSNFNFSTNGSPHNSNGDNEGGSTTSSSRAHVPQIIMDSNEVNRQSSILILSTHEAYETMHRIRLLSFLLLMYSSIHMLRDISMYIAPPMNDPRQNIIIPPGDPTDTSMPGIADNDYDEELPQWQNRDYIEMAICAVAVYVALLGMKVTSELLSLGLVRRFSILLLLLGISWNWYLFDTYVDQLKARESQEDYADGKVFSDALMAIALPFMLWAMFFLRAVQFYLLVKEAEDDSQRRSMTLAGAIGGGPDAGDASVINTGRVSVIEVTSGADGDGDGNRNDGTGYDLELQVSERSLT